MLGELLEAVRRQGPLVHAITNYVTANDCANVLLACGASPIMADDPAEAEEVTALCAALTLNLGTLSQDRAHAMERAGRRANALNRPVVLDPVGVGISRLRTKTSRELLERVRFTAIRGNRSELETLAGVKTPSRGVDAAREAAAEPAEAILSLARGLAGQTGAVVVMTGGVDLIADGGQACLVRNGHEQMARVTGTGCQLSVLTAAFLAANPDKPFWAAVAAACAMGLCGELAWGRMGALDGSASYGRYLIDAVSSLTPEQLEKGARYELR